jgi:acyl-CoA thioesterase I
MHCLETRNLLSYCLFPSHARVSWTMQLSRRALLSGIVVLASLGSCARGATPAPNRPLPENQPLRIACVGDSITRGHGALDRSYPIQLVPLLPATWVVKNFGHDGVMAVTRSPAPIVRVKEFTDATAFNPDVVILGLGTNDAAMKESIRRDFAEDYAGLIRHFQALPARPRIFVLTPPPLMPGRDDARMNNLAHEMVPRIREVAAREGATVIELHGVKVLQNPQLYPDKVHPNGAGYGLIAQQVAAALLRATEKK